MISRLYLYLIPDMSIATTPSTRKVQDGTGYLPNNYQINLLEKRGGLCLVISKWLGNFHLGAGPRKLPGKITEISTD